MPNIEVTTEPNRRCWFRFQLTDGAFSALPGAYKGVSSLKSGDVTLSRKPIDAPSVLPFREMNIMAIQAAFQPVVDHALELCMQRFKGRLEGVYVGGSVAHGEAWPGESDVDWFMFLTDEPTADDKAWCRETGKALESRYRSAKEFHLNVYPTDMLRTERSMMKFIFKYNSVCLFGDGHLDRIEQEGVIIPSPSPRVARGRIGWVKRCTNGLAKGRLPDELFQGAVQADLSRLSPTDFSASRKLIRNFLLLEGAYVLMLTGDFESFRRDDVLPRLASRYPRWQPLIRTATTILDDPVAAGVSPQIVVEQVLPFARWAIEETEKQDH